MERRVTTSTVPVSMDVLKGQQAIPARKDVNQDIMGRIAVTVVVKAALLPIIVTELQDDVTVGVNKEDQIRDTNTQACSCTESYTIVIVLVLLLIVVTGSIRNFVIWKRNAAKFSRMSLGNMPQPTSKREEKDHQYTELEAVDKSKTYE